MEFVENPQLCVKSEKSDAGGIKDAPTPPINEFDVFGIGDVAGLPTAKTGAAVRKQAPVVASHINSLISNGELTDAKYSGYSSCPIVTGYGKMVLAEFDYRNVFMPDPKLKKMLVFDSSKESWKLWMLKKHILPYLYWNRMVEGADI